MGRTTRLATAALVLALAGCDEGGSGVWDAAADTPADGHPDTTGDPAVDTPGDEPADVATDTTPETHAGEPSFGSDATITDVHEMADIINGMRNDYAVHERYWGIPFGTGEFHTTVTWPLTMTWSDEAAAIAQVEADAVASGAAPSGTDVVSSGYFWVDGVNSSPYMVTTDEYYMSTANTFARMSIFYHDFGGHGPVLTQMGLGASAESDGGTVWVLVLVE